jgi:hypothetical protein
MQLPGAVSAPTPTGQSIAPPVAGGPKREAAFSGHFSAAKPPGPDKIVDEPLSLLGLRGALQIGKSGDDLVVTRFVAIGDKISRPNQSCEVSMGADAPIRLKPLGAPDGVRRFELDSSACPLQFDVLNGAIRARSPRGPCSFAEADCRIDAGGLWGPSGGGFSDAQIKSIEKERGAMENAVRAHFRTLLSKYKKDKPATEAAIREQAAFSAERAQACRDYDHEEAIGFCALRLTEARDYLLQARLAGEGVATGSEKTKKPARPRSKPASAAQAPAPAAIPAAQ